MIPRSHRGDHEFESRPAHHLSISNHSSFLNLESWNFSIRIFSIKGIQTQITIFERREYLLKKSIYLKISEKRDVKWAVHYQGNI